LITDLDEVPDPAWDLDPIIAERPDASVEMGRGCPFACEFCSTNDFFRRRFRMKSPSRVLGQMVELERRYGARRFSLVHDMFTVDRRKVVEFALEAARLGCGYEWACSARTDCVDDELLEVMYRGGCRKLFFGVESGSMRLQASMQKGLDLHQARRVIERTDELGMRSTVSLIVGFPDEAEPDLRDTVDMFLFASRFERTDVHLHLLSALAGTPITARYQEKLQLDLTQDCWSGNEQELMAIRAHRELFVNFYSLPTRLPRQFLRELKWFLRCGALRCNWLLQTLHRESGHIFDIFRKFYRADHMRSPDWYRSEAFHGELLRFAEELTESPQFPVSRVMVEFYRQLEATVKPSQEPDDSAYYDGCVPSLPAGARLLCCRGDVLGIVEALRMGAPFPHPVMTPTWILAIPSDRHAELLQITPIAGRLLQWCDGRRKAVDIGCMARRQGLAPAILSDREAAQILFERLYSAGLVRFARRRFEGNNFEPDEPVADRGERHEQLVHGRQATLDGPNLAVPTRRETRARVKVEAPRKMITKGPG
jgi:hypothetical protein